MVNMKVCFPISIPLSYFWRYLGLPFSSLRISELEYGVFENDLAPIVLSFLGQPKVHPSAEAVTSLLVTKRCMRFNLVNGIKTTRPLHAYELFHSLLLFLLSGCPFKIWNWKNLFMSYCMIFSNVILGWYHKKFADEN